MFIKGATGRGILFFLLLIFVASCKAPSTPKVTNPNVGKRTKQYYSIQQETEAGIDTMHIFAALRVDAGKDYQATTIHAVNAHADAYFGVDSDLVNVTSATVNGTPLVNAFAGDYVLNNPSFYSGSSTLMWDVEGYDGGSIRDTSTMPGILDFATANTGDTVSKSAGFTLGYTGYNGGDIIVGVNFNYALTYTFGDTAIANDTSTWGSMGKTTIDNGSVTVSSADLSGFTPNIWITLTLTHWTYHLTYSSTGQPVGVHSTYTVDVPLFLKP